MKKIIFICFFFIGCAKYNQKEIRSDIDIRLTNTSIKDSTDLKNNHNQQFSKELLSFI